MYTRMQRIVYNIKRHAVGIIAVLCGLLMLQVVGDSVWVADNVHYVTMKLISVGLGISIFLFVWKFAFPKITLQEKIKDEAIAVSIFAGLLAIAIALMF